MTRDEAFVWFRCLGEAGYSAPVAVPRQRDLAQFPDVFFDDPTGRVRLADMSGRWAERHCPCSRWSNRLLAEPRYGKFGPRITMSTAGDLHIGDGFDPRRLFLVDLDGSGCADVVYVESGRVHFWFNQSGNAVSEKQTIVGTPYITTATSMTFTDFYGTGTTALLWSYDHGEQPGQQLQSARLLWRAET